jgi:hypothetical protein
MTTVAVPQVRRARAVAAPVPLSRATSVEIRKMFDTRSGFWLMASIVIAALVATTAVIMFGSDDDLTYSTFAAAIGFPMTVILPIIALLSVTSEWSQRSGLTTFTLVPHRRRVIAAKAASSLAVAVTSMLLAFAIGALGTVVGTAIAGTDQVWDVSVSDCLYIVLGNILGLLMGFVLGMLIRNSPGAIVAYFLYAFLLPTLAGMLAASQEWFRDLQPWVDFYYAQTAMFNGALTAEQWAHVGVAGAIWLALPLATGLALVMRSEVK